MAADDSDVPMSEADVNEQCADIGQDLDTCAASSMNPNSFTMNTPVLDGGLDEESSEALMICLTIAGLALLPQFL